MRKIQARHTARVALPAAMLLVLLAAACSEGAGGAPCLPEDVERCTCDDGRDGFQVCPLDGGGYSSCDCDLDASPYLPEAGEEASADAGDEGDASGGLQFMSPCSSAAGSPQCPIGDTCYDFPAKGQFCSKQCKVATDCPAPSPGCNGMGECKAP
ncbi:MAG TPA: hypothetical protein VIF09_15960 [Polyangiaceae bacterium]|jgi:hypothetical protein